MRFVSASAFAFSISMVFSVSAQSQILQQAIEGIRIPLVEKPTSRPMAVAYHPELKKYFIADGGLGAVPDGGIPVSKSEVHVYSDKGEHLQNVKPGLDNRAIYYNNVKNRLECVTYNISSDAGFMPNTGIYALKLDQEGKLTPETDDIIAHNPAFGDAGTMPSYNATENVFYAKQEHSPRVLIAKLDSREPVGEIKLDIEAAKAAHDDVHEHFVAYTGIKGEELALLDIDHKAVLVFDLAGKFVGRSELPKTLKLRANNHYNGIGYANGMYFVYNEPEGEFGVYYGFKISDQAH